MTWLTPTILPEQAELIESPLLGLDTETKDPNLKKYGPGWPAKDGALVGFSLAWMVDGRRRSTYIPLRHGGGENYHEPEQALGWLRHLLKARTKPVLGANIMYDLGWLSTEGISLSPKIQVKDVQWVQSLINENLSSYSLAALLRAHNLPPKDEVALASAATSRGLDPKSDLWRLPGNLVGAYAERDASALLDIYPLQVPELQAQDLERAVEFEHSLLPCLLAMRRNGVRVNVNRAEEVREQLKRKETEYAQQLRSLTGFDVNVWSADSIARAFDAASISYGQTATGKPSFTKEWLERHPAELAQLVLRQRKASKACDTFIENMILGHQRNGRIHAEFHPLREEAGGARYGRFSCSNPNLQQVPERDPDIGPLVRGLFEPEEGEEWCSVDYTSQEPKIQTHYAILRKVTGWEELKRIFTENPKVSQHDVVVQWTGLERKVAKVLNLSLSYGGGIPTISAQLGVGPSEARELLQTYHQKMPYVKELSDDCASVAERRGYITLMGGRRTHFDYWEPNGYREGKRALPLNRSAALAKWGSGNIRRARCHVALNRLVQGSAAYQTKVAMIQCHAAGYTPLIQVHDELAFSVKDRSMVAPIQEIMNGCVKLEIPVVSDADVGPTWGAARPYVKED